jgi:hypothetical protein
MSSYSNRSARIKYPTKVKWPAIVNRSVRVKCPALIEYQAGIKYRLQYTKGSSMVYTVKCPDRIK